MSDLFDSGFAAVIGVGADLAVTIDDATAVAQLLQALTRCVYLPQQVHLLTGPQVRRQPILDALDGLAAATKPASTAVIIASPRTDEVFSAGIAYSRLPVALLEGLVGYGASAQDGYAWVLDVAIWGRRKAPARTGDYQNPIIKVCNLQNNFAPAWYAHGAQSYLLMKERISGYVGFVDGPLQLLHSQQQSLPAETRLRSV